MTLNEASTIERSLEAVSRLGPNVEAIVVDGESEDGTARIAGGHRVTVLSTSRGRGQQLRLGAEHARGEVLWFLHADSIPPPDALARIRRALEASSPLFCSGSGTNLESSRLHATVNQTCVPRKRWDEKAGLPPAGCVKLPI